MLSGKQAPWRPAGRTRSGAWAAWRCRWAGTSLILRALAALVPRRIVQAVCLAALTVAALRGLDVARAYPVTRVGAPFAAPSLDR